MFSKIMVPVDLAHKEKLVKGLQCGADLAKHYGAEVIMVGVTADTPGSVAHTPEEYRTKLDAFAADFGASNSVKASGKAIVVNDPAIDLDSILLKAVEETGADLVVMASHVPGIKEYIWPSNGGKIAGHAAASVMVVRD